MTSPKPSVIILIISHGTFYEIPNKEMNMPVFEYIYTK
jgi:hypothetical protein